MLVTWLLHLEFKLPPSTRSGDTLWRIHCNDVRSNDIRSNDIRWMMWAFAGHFHRCNVAGHWPAGNYVHQLVRFDGARIRTMKQQEAAPKARDFISLMYLPKSHKNTIRWKHQPGTQFSALFLNPNMILFLASSRRFSWRFSPENEWRFRSV